MLQSRHLKILHTTPAEWTGVGWFVFIAMFSLALVGMVALYLALGTDALAGTTIVIAFGAAAAFFLGGIAVCRVCGLKLVETDSPSVRDDGNDDPAASTKDDPRPPVASNPRRQRESRWGRAPSAWGWFSIFAIALFSFAYAFHITTWLLRLKRNHTLILIAGASSVFVAAGLFLAVERLTRGTRFALFARTAPRAGTINPVYAVYAAWVILCLLIAAYLRFVVGLR